MHVYDVGEPPSSQFKGESRSASPHRHEDGHLSRPGSDDGGRLKPEGLRTSGTLPRSDENGRLDPGPGGRLGQTTHDRAQPAGDQRRVFRSEVQHTHTRADAHCRAQSTARIRLRRGPPAAWISSPLKAIGNVGSCRPTG